MSLSAMQRDMLGEIINIGAGKAAKHLSELLADAIELRVPVVDLVSFDELSRLLGIAAEDEVVCIRQVIGGSIDGQILLLFHSGESRQLVEALIGAQPPGAAIDMRSFEHEAMTEIGNIVISACVSAMADFMGSAIRLTMPQYEEGLLEGVLRQTVQAQAERQALVMRTSLRAARRAVAGTLILTFSVAEMSALLARLDAAIAGLLAS